ncbi:hypothetical protein [Oceanobacillus sp. J11TS1]|uniref:hypothetical protein n=1 Tax=Oceanobacillus sp. J11TS1 TaxID=2807191 RepID=UPI001B24C1CF|nr:hypothetical protein [Oceanobacillus sp. J11TS1]GIO25160.1 hypothetical protein J11TS1_37410 [Oceanobacillus sp. J11TS1]
MNEKFSLNATIKIIYFNNEEVDHQETIFGGSVTEWRNDVGADWNGFEKGDSFLLNDNRVRVYKPIETKDESGFIINAVYCIGLSSLNPNKIHYDNLVID